VTSPSSIPLKRPRQPSVDTGYLTEFESVAQFFAIFSSKPATLNIEKAKDLVQSYWICDTSKAMRELGYRQNVSLEEGIKRTCEWYKKMKWI